MTARAERAEGIRRPSALRSIEAAAVAGLVHASLLLVSTYLLLRAPQVTADAPDVRWYVDAANQRSTALGLNLMAIGMIAFLWFVAVIRRRVGERENKFFGTVFLGSALLLAGTRVIAAVLFSTPTMSAYLFGVQPGAESVALWQTSGLTLATIVGTRLESVFVISTTTVGRLSEALPAWLIWFGYLTGLVLLVIPLSRALLIWLFPVWVAAVSVTLLVRHHLNGSELDVPATS